MIALFALIGILCLCGLWLVVEKVAGGENRFVTGGSDAEQYRTARLRRNYTRTEGSHSHHGKRPTS